MPQSGVVPAHGAKNAVSLSGLHAKDSTDYRNFRSGRVVPRRVPARQGLSRGWRRAPFVGAQPVAHRAPARPHRPPARRPAGSAVDPAADRRGAARRVLQPGGDVVRAGLVGHAAADRRVQQPGRDARARGHPPGQAGHALLSGQLERDVRQGARRTAERGHAVPPALALRRLEGLRALHHRELP